MKATPLANADPLAAEKQAALTAYKNYWAEQVKAYAKGDSKGTQLKKYAVGAALGQSNADMKTMKRLGVVSTGRPVSDVKVTALDEKRQVPSASLTDCLDVSGWKQVNTKTGKELPVDPKRLDRYVMNVKAEKWGQQWVVLEVAPQERAC